MDRTLSVKKPDPNQNAILICGYHHCHRKLRKPLYDQRFPVSFLQAEDKPTMTKDYTPKNTDFVWNGDEARTDELLRQGVCWNPMSVRSSR